MSVSVTTAKVQYTLSSAVQALPVPFYFLDNAHLKAIRARAGAADMVLVLGTDYTLTGAGDEAGGTLTTIATNLVVGDKITIKRDVPITQLVNYVYNDKFPAEVHERALDKLTMAVQQLKEVTDRAVQFPESEVAGTGNIMPAAASRAAKILGYDATGNAVQLYDPVSAVFASGDFVFANSVAALKAVSVTALTNGQQAQVAGYASVGDGGGGLFAYDSGSSETEDIGLVVAPNTGSGRWKRITPPGSVSVLWFGAKGDGVSDDTAAIQAAINVFGNAGGTVRLGNGIFRITDTLVIGTDKRGVVLLGDSANVTKLVFSNATSLKALISITPQSQRTCLKNLQLIDETARTSTAIRIAAYPQTLTYVNRKNLFHAVDVTQFAVGVDFTTDGSLTDGSLQDWTDDNTFEHCFFNQNATTLLGNNQQCFNNNFVGCNFETTYTGDDAAIILHDNCGGQFNFFGGSMITRGLLYRASWPSGGSNLWNNGRFYMNGVRVEARSTHYGALIEDNAALNFLNKSRFLEVFVINCSILMFNETLDIIRFVGRMNATFEGVYGYNGTLNIRSYAVQSYSGVNSGSVQGPYGGGVRATRCRNVFFIADTATTYGAISKLYTNKVVVHSDQPGTGAMAFDSDSFYSLRQQTNVEQLGYGLSFATPKRLVFSNDLITSGLASLKVMLPAGARPIKFGIYKHPLRFTETTAYKLYLVKDKAAWGTGTFDKSTDAVEVADIPSTVDKAGWFEADVVLLANSFGTELTAGATGWTEGRIYIEKVSGANNHAGFVMVEYI